MALLKLFVGAGVLLRVGAFSIYHVDDFDTKHSVGEDCAKAMLADIACHEYVRSWYQQFGHNPYSIGDVALTNAICTNTCSGSLRTWFETVSKDCQKELLGDGGFVSMEYVNIMWAHRNETCLKDEGPGRYCNDILTEFHSDGVPPCEELCHPCYGRRLALLQSSQYSGYNIYQKQDLERVYETFGGSGPTDVPPPLEEEEEEPAVNFCLTELYHITKEGDTCDSIFKAAGIDLDTIRDYNAWAGLDCENLHTSTDFYGKSICIGPLGDAGTLAEVQEFPSIPQKVSSANGPTYYWRMPVPEGSRAAKGTTSKCNQWHVIAESDTCASICNEYNICVSGLMWDMNPSLGSTICDTSLVPGVALCVTPMSIWSKEDNTEQDGPEEDASNDNESNHDELREDLRA